jgi:transposase InsO family protein
MAHRICASKTQDRRAISGPLTPVTRGLSRSQTDSPPLRHVRTRVRSPQTNGVIERFFGTSKYEHLYRAPIDDGGALAMETAASATSTTASGHPKLSTIEHRARPTSTRDAASH